VKDASSRISASLLESSTHNNFILLMAVLSTKLFNLYRLFPAYKLKKTPSISCGICLATAAACSANPHFRSIIIALLAFTNNSASLFIAFSEIFSNFPLCSYARNQQEMISIIFS